MYDLIIVGAGGFSRELYHWVNDWIQADRNRLGQFRVKGFLSIDNNLLDGFDLPIGILGDEETYTIQPNDRFVMGIGKVLRKKIASERLLEMGARFITLVHPTAIVCPSAKLGSGAVLCPFTVVSADVTIADFALLNIYSSAGHDARVGKHCVLSPYATLNGFVQLGDEVFMGTHATVVANKHVGHRSNISANSLVVRNVPDDTTVLGSPGKMIANLSRKS